MVEDARKVNVYEDEKYRKLSKLNTALVAKLKFIEEQYDYTSTAKSMSMQDFKELMESNLTMNKAMNPFMTKLETT